MLTYGLFIGDTILLVEVSDIYKSCILGLETNLMENLGSPDYPLVVQWLVLLVQFFVYFLLGFSLFVCCCFVSLF